MLHEYRLLSTATADDVYASFLLYVGQVERSHSLLLLLGSLVVQLVQLLMRLLSSAAAVVGTSAVGRGNVVRSVDGLFATN